MNEKEIDINNIILNNSFKGWGEGDIMNVIASIVGFILYISLCWVFPWGLTYSLPGGTHKDGFIVSAMLNIFIAGIVFISYVLSNQ